MNLSKPKRLTASSVIREPKIGNASSDTSEPRPLTEPSLKLGGLEPFPTSEPQARIVSEVTCGSRLALQDEGGTHVRIDMYHDYGTAPFRIAVPRERLVLYAMWFLEAGLRQSHPATATATIERIEIVK